MFEENLGLGMLGRNDLAFIRRDIRSDILYFYLFST